jgi:hypothetical protein
LMPVSTVLQCSSRSCVRRSTDRHDERPDLQQRWPWWWVRQHCSIQYL